MKTGSESNKSAGTVFVAGATGFTGREVVRILAEKNIKVIAHVRPDSASLDEWTHRFSSFGAEVDSTAWEKSSMAATFKRMKPTHIFALLGTTRARMKKVARSGGNPKAQSYNAVDYGLTALLVDAAIEAKIAPLFLYLSAVGADGQSLAGSRNPSAYFKARRDAEKKVSQCGLPYIIARPSFITGPGRDDNRPGERIGSAFIDASLSLASIFDRGKMKARYGSISNTELARILVHIALDPEAKNKVFEPEDMRNISR